MTEDDFEKFVTRERRTQFKEECLKEIVNLSKYVDTWYVCETDGYPKIEVLDDDGLFVNSEALDFVNDEFLKSEYCDDYSDLGAAIQLILMEEFLGESVEDGDSDEDSLEDTDEEEEDE